MGDKLFWGSVDPATTKKEYDRGSFVRTSMVWRKEAMQMESCIVSTFIQMFGRITEAKVGVGRFRFVGVEMCAAQDQDGHGNVLV